MNSIALLWGVLFEYVFISVLIDKFWNVLILNFYISFQVLEQQKEGQVREGIYVARGEVLRNEASELGLSTHELDELLGPITESCTKDSISNGKHWIFTNAQSPAKNQWLARYLMWK